MPYPYRLNLIVEGDEELRFFRLVERYGLHQAISLTITNAHGASGIPSRFQSFLASPYYDCVLCCYDVDYRYDRPNSPYCQTRSMLKRILGSEALVERVSICNNPNILQWFLLGMGELEDVALLFASKSACTPLLHRYWPEIGNKKDYDASEWQLNVLCDSFEYEPTRYEQMLIHAERLSADYRQNNSPGSNMLPLLRALSSGDLMFFIEIARAIKKTSE